MPKPLLTIGIPTFNRAVFLEELLKKIVPTCNQLGIEVLVSDNCSTDSTAQVSEEYLYYPCFRYQKNPKNLGFDGNINELFKQAQGKFLWLMGDDDYPDVRQLKNLLGLLRNNPEVGLCFVNYQSLELIKWEGQPDTLKYHFVSAQVFADSVLHKATLISTNIINLDYFRYIEINPNCFKKEWIHLHFLLGLCDWIKSKNLQNLVINNYIIAQRPGSLQLTGAWVMSFVDRFIFILKNTTLPALDTTWFKRNFFKLNIIHQFNRFGETLPWSHCFFLYRKVVANFPVTFLEKIAFFVKTFLSWLVHLLLFWVNVDLPASRAVGGMPAVGCQAVVEGVFVYNSDVWTMAVRDPAQNIVIKKGGRSVQKWKNIIQQIPLIRGIFVLSEALAIGWMAWERSVEVMLGKPNIKIPFIEKFFSVLVAGVVFCLLFLVVPASFFVWLQKFRLAVFWTGFLEGFLGAVIFGLLLWAGTMMPDLRRIFRFHGAQHLALRHTILRTKCGAGLVVAFFVVNLLVFSVIGVAGFWARVAIKFLLIPLVVGLAYEAVIFVKLWKVPALFRRALPERLLQSITVLPPTADQLAVATAAWQAFNEEEVKHAPGS